MAKWRSQKPGAMWLIGELFVVGRKRKREGKHDEMVIRTMGGLSRWKGGFTWSKREFRLFCLGALGKIEISKIKEAETWKKEQQ